MKTSAHTEDQSLPQVRIDVLQEGQVVHTFGFPGTAFPKATPIPGTAFPKVTPIRDPVLKIGRDDKAAIRIENDDGVSRVHGVMEIKPDRVDLIDLGSGMTIRGEGFNAVAIRKETVVDLSGFTSLRITPVFNAAPLPAVAPCDARAVANSALEDCIDLLADSDFKSLKPALQVLKIHRAVLQAVTEVEWLGEEMCESLLTRAMEQHDTNWTKVIDAIFDQLVFGIQVAQIVRDAHRNVQVRSSEG